MSKENLKEKYSVQLDEFDEIWCDNIVNLTKIVNRLKIDKFAIFRRFVFEKSLFTGEWVLEREIKVYPDFWDKPHSDEIVAGYLDGIEQYEKHFE